MRTKGFRLNILDITIISAVVLIIAVSVITVWRDKTADKIQLAVVLLSDEYIVEVFEKIEVGAEIYNSSSGKQLGTINSIKNEINKEVGRIELDVLAEADEFGGGALIDGDRYYIGDRLSVNVGNARVVMMVKQLEMRN